MDSAKVSKTGRLERLEIGNIDLDRDAFHDQF